MSATTPQAPVTHSAPEAPELEEDLSVLLDEQARRLKKKNQRYNYFLVAVIVGILGSAGWWYAKSPENRAAVAEVIQHLKEGRKDFALVADPLEMAKQFDDSLAEISTRNEAINDASVSMGVDPTTVEEDGMDAEMSEMMGGEGRTVAARNQLLKQKMGAFAEAQVQRAEAKKAAKLAKEQPVATTTPAPEAPAAPSPRAFDQPLMLGN